MWSVEGLAHTTRSLRKSCTVSMTACSLQGESSTRLIHQREQKETLSHLLNLWIIEQKTLEGAKFQQQQKKLMRFCLSWNVAIAFLLWEINIDTALELCEEVIQVKHGKKSGAKCLRRTGVIEQDCLQCCLKQDLNCLGVIRDSWLCPAW